MESFEITKRPYVRKEEAKPLAGKSFGPDSRLTV